MEPKAKARVSLASTPLGAESAPELPPAHEPFDREASDLELLGRFHAGDHTAFGLLLARYQGSIYNFAFRSLGDRQAAEDLTQEVFLRVIQGATGFQSQSKFSTWLFTIARNLCVDHGRRMRHRRHASLDAPGMEADGGAPVRLLDRLPHHQPGTERSASGARIRERVAKAVAELPADQREVFLLRQVNDVPFAEIATLCGIPENTVKSRMRYALERLQKALSDYEDDVSASGR
jgi:RNA polymerase sigma-70 factor (ECF subfamily)